MNSEQYKDQVRAKLMLFLDSIARPGFQPSSFSDEINLIDEGVIDSLALIQIIFHLEEEHAVDLQTIGIDPNDLGSIAGILSIIERATP